MKRVVIGTAGHIDHGKTLLTKALTGIDTDRLAEEKARGITIELGFAPMRLSDGTEISLVDVPGHEKFVRTMMAGVSGIDGVLLVVAADDGVMPQTREHFDILKLLDVRRGVVVLTKADIADADQIDAVRSQIAELVRGSFLESAPVCPVSALNGTGIDELKREIERMVLSIGERDCARPFRLPIDRVFSVSGFGSVATGTLTEGTMRVGAAVEIYPEQARASIRSLQTHGKAEETALAGMRTAVSFSALNADHLDRGQNAAEPDSLLTTDLLTARIAILDDCPYRIRNSSQLHLFHGTQECVCKLRLLDGDQLRAGESGYAQLKLAKPISVRWDDRFLLRFFSPVITVGGGMILSCGGTRLRRNNDAVLERLNRLADADHRLAQRIEDAGLSPVLRERLRRYGNLSPEEYARAESDVLRAGRAVEIVSGALIGRDSLARGLTECESLLSRFHREYPLQAGMGVAELRSRMFADGSVPADAILNLWIRDGKLKSEGGKIALHDFVPVFTQEHKIMQRRILHHYREAWFIAPDIRKVQEKFARFGALYDQVIVNMRMEGMLVPLSRCFWVHREAYLDAVRIMNELARDHGSFTLADFRTAAGISRKYSQLFVEYFDRIGLTRRVGDEHLLLHAERNGADA